MNVKQTNRKESKDNSEQKRVLSAHKMQKLERLGFDADLVALLHRSWRDERRMEQNALSNLSLRAKRGISG